MLNCLLQPLSTGPALTAAESLDSQSLSMESSVTQKHLLWSANTSPTWLTSFTQLGVKLKRSQLSCHWEHLDMNLLSPFFFLILKARAPPWNNAWPSMH